MEHYILKLPDRTFELFITTERGLDARENQKIEDAEQAGHDYYIAESDEDAAAYIAAIVGANPVHLLDMARRNSWRDAVAGVAG